MNRCCRHWTWIFATGLAVAAVLPLTNLYGDADAKLGAQQPLIAKEAAAIAGKDNADPAKKKAKREPVDEAAVMQFVAANHPELSNVLKRLREQRPDDFHNAVRDLSQQMDRIERVRRRNPDKATYVQERWNLHSRIQLLIARRLLSPDSALDAELRQLIEKDVDLRLAYRIDERDRAKKHLSRLDASVAELQNERTRLVDQEWKRVLDGKPYKGKAKLPSTP